MWPYYHKNTLDCGHKAFVVWETDCSGFSHTKFEYTLNHVCKKSCDNQKIISVFSGFCVILGIKNVKHKLWSECCLIFRKIRTAYLFISKKKCDKKEDTP